MNNAPTKGTVEAWLRHMGCAPTEQPDPTSAWHLEFDYPAGAPNKLHVVVPSGNPAQLVIASLTMVDSAHLQAFERLDDESKESFLWQLRRTLNQIDVEFILHDIGGERECPKRFEVRVTRYGDGLTLDSFAQSVGAVFKVQVATIWLIVEHLGGKGFGPGSRFDFKKLGL